MQFDKVIIGAGLYGLYAAERCGKRGESVLVLEYDDAPFQRATYINQARVHMGYHYPRSYSTAIKSAHYFNRFVEDYGFCIEDTFDQIYATSSSFSWTNAQQFREFCSAASIPCDAVDPHKYFNADLCDGAFLTKEYTYDASILREHFLDMLKKMDCVHIVYGARITGIVQNKDSYTVRLASGNTVEAPYILNATYASVNQILHLLYRDNPNAFPDEMARYFPMKYELCEIILCSVNGSLANTGLTVMDGPFFSIMPFGKTGLHSLTAVTFTPHMTSCKVLPAFACQERDGSACSSEQLGNCNECPNKPISAWPYMSALARKYMLEKYRFSFHSAMYSMKPILSASEIDDSRPTVIRKLSENPTFISVLSGKINTVYDLDEVL